MPISFVMQGEWLVSDISSPVMIMSKSNVFFLHHALLLYMCKAALNNVSAFFKPELSSFLNTVAAGHKWSRFSRFYMGRSVV